MKFNSYQIISETLSNENPQPKKKMSGWKKAAIGAGIVGGAALGAYALSKGKTVPGQAAPKIAQHLKDLQDAGYHGTHHGVHLAMGNFADAEKSKKELEVLRDRMIKNKALYNVDANGEPNAEMIAHIMTGHRKAAEELKNIYGGKNILIPLLDKIKNSI